MGTLWTLQSSHPGLSLYSAQPLAYGTAYYTLSLGTNVVLTALIVARLLAYRRAQLLQVARMLQDNHAAIEDAMFADLNKPRMETTVAEVSHLVTSALNAAEHLEEWAAPVPCPTKEAWRSSWNATLYKEPKGVALIIA